MIIKASYFRLAGFGDMDPIGMRELSDAQRRGKGLLIPNPRNLHDLAWWGNLLVQCRNAIQRPYAPHFASRLISHVRRLDRNWRETLRYRTNRPRIGELEESREAAAWLADQFRFLG